MKKMNFYTTNGWAGSNYDRKLSTKEIAAKVRAYAKKNFPSFKFSIRTKWSIYADSLYIELKSGVSAPFIEGSRSEERGYMSTMGTVKGWEDELSAEVFAALDAVTTYANSFNYDDSDGMQDYFDTNFYLTISVSYDYKVIEQKKESRKVAANTVAEASASLPSVDGVEIVDYSEKAIAVFGDTKNIKAQLKALCGRFNPSLNYNGGKRAGWIFSKKKAEEVRELLAPAKGKEAAEELPAPHEVIYIPELAEERQETGITEDVANELCCMFEMSYERHADTRYLFTFNEKNNKDESITVELCFCEDLDDKKSMPKEWHRRGWTSEVLYNYWSIAVYVTDVKGYCWGKYNPTVKHDGKRSVIDSNYMMRGTRDNAVKLFREIQLRAFKQHKADRATA